MIGRNPSPYAVALSGAGFGDRNGFFLGWAIEHGSAMDQFDVAAVADMFVAETAETEFVAETWEPDCDGAFYTYSRVPRYPGMSREESLHQAQENGLIGSHVQWDECAPITTREFNARCFPLLDDWHKSYWLRHDGRYCQSTYFSR